MGKDFFVGRLGSLLSLSTIYTFQKNYWIEGGGGSVIGSIQNRENPGFAAGSFVLTGSVFVGAECEGLFVLDSFPNGGD